MTDVGLSPRLACDRIMHMGSDCDGWIGGWADAGPYQRSIMSHCKNSVRQRYGTLK